MTAADIQAYHVYVDGDFKTSVKGTERTKALVENVHSSKVCFTYCKCKNIIIHTITARFYETIIDL